MKQLKNIQIMKTILFNMICLISLNGVTCKESSLSTFKCKDISTCLSLRIELNKDDFKVNDSLTLKTYIKNNTNDTLVFYPNAYVYLIRVPLGFHSNRKVIHNTLDMRKYIVVLPQHEFAFSYKAEVDSNFFADGINSFQLVYVASEKLVSKVYDGDKTNELCGAIESKSLRITLKM